MFQSKNINSPCHFQHQIEVQKLDGQKVNCAKKTRFAAHEVNKLDIIPCKNDHIQDPNTWLNSVFMVNSNAQNPSLKNATSIVELSQASYPRLPSPVEPQKPCKNKKQTHSISDDSDNNSGKQTHWSYWFGRGKNKSSLWSQWFGWKKPAKTGFDDESNVVPRYECDHIPGSIGTNHLHEPQLDKRQTPALLGGVTTYTINTPKGVSFQNGVGEQNGGLQNGGGQFVDELGRVWSLPGAGGIDRNIGIPGRVAIPGATPYGTKLFVEEAYHHHEQDPVPNAYFLNQAYFKNETNLKSPWTCARQSNSTTAAGNGATSAAYTTTAIANRPDMLGSGSSQSGGWSVVKLNGTGNGNGEF